MTEIVASLRRLARAPRFSLGVVIMLALGLGAAASLFSLVDAVLLRPLPFAEPDRLVWVWSTRVDRDRAFFSIPNFLDTRERASSFAGFAGFTSWGVNLAGDEPLRLSGVRVTPDFLQLLGARAAAGRVLAPGDEEAEGARPVVLSHGLWIRRFAGEPSVIGRSLRLGDETAIVVGILEGGFLFPGDPSAEIVGAISLARDARRGERGSNFLRVVARLRPGATVEAARRELAGITAELRAAFPTENGKHADPRVLPLGQELVGEHGRALSLLLVAVGLLLLVAGANLAGLLLARGIARRHEDAVRAALGASARRLALAPALDALVLALAGGGAGAWLAAWAAPGLATLAPSAIPRGGEAAVDGRALLFLAGVTLATALLVSIAPALRAGRGDPARLLVGGGATPRGRARRVLVAVELGLALVLATQTALVFDRLSSLGHVDPGFAPDGLLAARVSLPPARYATPAAIAGWQKRAVAELEGLPGVRAAAVANALPLSALNVRTDYTVAGAPPASAADVPAAQHRFVSPGYLAAMGNALRAGREPSLDEARPVAVVDETLARRHWPHPEDAVGAHLRIDRGTGPARDVEIVGVAATVRHASLAEPPTATLYEPLAQAPEAMAAVLAGNLSVVARLEPMGGAGAEAVRVALRAVDPEVPASTVRPLSASLAAALAPDRFQLGLLGGFGAAALLLAALGVHALVAHEVAGRRREIGIRRALGASAPRLAAQVAGATLRLAAGGALLGAAATLALSRWSGAAPLDVAFAAGAAALLLLIVAVAASLPASLAASRVDPIVALRA